MDSSEEPASVPAPEKQGICPACEQHGIFILIGQQNWPPEVAQRLGVPVSMLLYECSHCHSAISEYAILPD